MAQEHRFKLPTIPSSNWQHFHKVFTVTEQGKSVVKVPSNTLVEH